MVKQVGQGIKTAANEQFNIVTLVKGIGISYIITIPAFVIFAFILSYTSIPEKLISPVVIITTIVSVLTAGSTVTKNVKSRGWLNGGIVGLVYMIVLYLISSVSLNNYSLDRYTVTMIIIGVITGAIGGIIGINLKRNTHSRYKN